MSRTGEGRGRAADRYSCAAAAQQQQTQLKPRIMRSSFYYQRMIREAREAEGQRIASWGRVRGCRVVGEGWRWALGTGLGKVRRDCVAWTLMAPG